MAAGSDQQYMPDKVTILHDVYFAILNSKLSYPECAQCRYLAFQIDSPFLRQYSPQRLQKSWLLEVPRNDELKET
jgi:hypothetical protein